MWSYAFRRALGSVPTLFALAVITFFMMRMAPGGKPEVFVDGCRGEPFLFLNDVAIAPNGDVIAVGNPAKAMKPREFRADG